MAEKKQEAKVELEREYVIPLRREWQKVANYRRAGRAAKAIKKFIARHMKVPEHDVEKVKLDVYLNQEIWFRGHTKPPAKIKVKARKEGEIVKVELAEMPSVLKFARAKHEKRHLASKVEKLKEVPKERKPEEQTEEKKMEESEKEKAVAESRAKDAKQQAKAQKHLSKVKGESHHRMALQK